jgi:hypothetical protein
MKDTPVFAAGSPYTFANVGNNKYEWPKSFLHQLLFLAIKYLWKALVF